MNPRTRPRWWLRVLPVAGALLLLLILLLDGQREARRRQRASDLAPEPTARSPMSRALRRWMAATRVARHAADRPAPGRDDGGPPRHLSDLDRTPDEDQLLWAAEEELIASCMSKRGFTYLPNGKDDDPAAGSGRAPPDRRGDVAAARSTGYGIVARLQTGESPNITPDRNAEALARMTETDRAAFLEALRGPAMSPADPRMRQKVESVPLPGGGSAFWYRDSCLAEARRGLYGEDYEHNELGYGLASLRNQMLAAADADPAYRKDLDAWRGCMRARGFNEDRPAAAAKRLAAAYHAAKLSLDELRTQEVAIATADTECFVASDLGAARLAAEARAEDALLAQNAEALDAMKRARDAALDRAETVVGNGEL